MIIGGVVLVALLAPPSLANNFVDEDEENNDFAEFEDFDADDASFGSAPDVKPPSNKEAPAKPRSSADEAAADDFPDAFDDNDDDDGIVEEDSEFEHFHDDEEFEGFTKNEPTEKPSVPLGEPKLTMANVPMHFR